MEKGSFTVKRVMLPFSFVGTKEVSPLIDEGLS